MNGKYLTKESVSVFQSSPLQVRYLTLPTVNFGPWLAGEKGRYLNSIIAV